MPELPEVEIARRRLAAWTRDQVIVRAHVPKSRVLGAQSPKQVRAFLEGRTALDVERKGKSMLVRLSSAGALHLHLGMTGEIVLSGATHVRLELELEGGARVQFDDPRMFGRVAVGPWETLEAKYFGALGRDALRISAKDLFEVLLRSKRPIKTVLMDQARIAGVGNIYASEALWIAKIDPMRAANTIAQREVEPLTKAIKSTMRAAIARLAAGERYLSRGGENRFQVYGHEGEPCPRCGRPLHRFELGGRSTFWCRKCQS
jgi:formamidopyrimidine-DNA glycosylase